MGDIIWDHGWCSPIDLDDVVVGLFAHATGIFVYAIGLFACALGRAKSSNISVARNELVKRLNVGQ
ncbi:MAG: hypothetical protein ACP5P1_09310 [Acidimicrobiales bacterium]